MNNIQHETNTLQDISLDSSRNLLLTIRFDGTNYHGWQIQENALTIQEVFQNALKKVLGTCPDIKGCSRTDTGVHADMFCINMHTDNNIGCDKLINALNAHLPRDISVYCCREVGPGFHARYSCTAKQYSYIFYNGRARNPFYDKYSLYYYHHIDETVLNSCAKDFIGTYDYSAFCSKGSDIEDTVRSVTHASVTRQGDFIIFTVQADGFLYNMVRIMAGTLIRIIQKKFEPGCIKNIILSKNRKLAGPTSPAHGLFLTKVYY